MNVKTYDMPMFFKLSSLNDVKRHKRLPTSVRLAFMALLRTDIGSLAVTLPGLGVYLFDHGNPGPQADIKVKDLRMVTDVLLHGDIGFANAYMADQFETSDLTAVLEFFAVNFEKAGALGRGNKLKNLLVKLVDSLTRQNTKRGSKQNILAHYDLGNAFYEKWLDPTMTYSSAIYEGQEDIVTAQNRKYDAIARSLGAKPGDHILEIGSGWGGFAEYAAKTYGSKITTITISNAQHEYARKRIFKAGLAEQVDVRLCDYRDVEGSFDGVASIEMFEAVGESFWPGYFDKLSGVLKEGKRAALQIITIDDELFDGYRNRVDFIQKYIFPGGMLPSEAVLKEQFDRAGLVYESAQMFGESYAETLRVWAENFRRFWPEIQTLGFDKGFRNLWEYYLCYCEAGFKTGRTDVGHFVLRKP